MFLQPTFVVICVARALRTFGFGSLSVILGTFLVHRGFTPWEVGILFSASLIEDAIVTALVCSATNRFRPKTILLFFSALLAVGAILMGFASTKWLIGAACIIGVLSPSGFEGGPFSPVEQSLVSHAVPPRKLLNAYSWYNLIGFAGAALGALAAGAWAALAGEHAYDGLFTIFAFTGLGLMCLYALIPPSTAPCAETTIAAKSAAEEAIPLSKSRKQEVYRLAALQSVDSFGGGFVQQSLIAYWFTMRFGVGAQFLGPLFFTLNVLAAISFLIAPMIARRVGLLRTMVFTHLPCSISLILIPFMPSASMAAALMIMRGLFSSMDVPVRQAFLMLLVPEKERTAAAGITNASRAVAQGLSPSVSGFFLTSASLASLSFVCAGTLKAAYDLLLFYAFRNVSLTEPEERDYASGKTQPFSGDESCKQSDIQRALPGRAIDNAD